MNARTIAGVQAQIAQPTDLYEFIRAARYDLSGTDYPGALELGSWLAAHFGSAREKRVVLSLFMVALESHSELSGIAQRELVEDYLAHVDLKSL